MAIETTDIVTDASWQVICNIGQVSEAQKRELDKAAKAGRIAKWRGHWYPVAGAPFGIGPLKTCWGPQELLDQYTDFHRRPHP